MKIMNQLTALLHVTRGVYFASYTALSHAYRTNIYPFLTRLLFLLCSSFICFLFISYVF